MDRLENAIIQIRNSGPETEPYIYTSDKRIPIDIPYSNKCCKTTRTSTHNGQRKLFGGTLFFCTKYLEQGDLVIYGGSAPGYNIKGIAELFPKNHFILIDPRQLDIKAKDNNITCLREKISVDFFEKPKNLVIDDKKIYESPISYGSRILFISDIRGDIEMKGQEWETIVKRNMELQSDVVKKLNPKAFCLKFRIPYTEKKKVVTFRYLDGHIVLQPFNRQSSAESRLICKRPSNGYTEKDYKLSIHENQMFYVNTVLREWCEFNTTDGVKGGDKCFDCFLEETFCKCYLEKYKRFKDVVEFRNWINDIHPILSLVYTEPVLKITRNNIQEVVPVQKYQLDLDIKKLHGNLPLKNRDIREFLSLSDIVLFCTNIIKKYTSMDGDYILKVLNPHRDLLIEMATDKTMDAIKNNDYLEFQGDRVFALCLSHFFTETYPNCRDVGTLNNYMSKFQSKHMHYEIFCKALDLESELIVYEDHSHTEKAVADMFEAFMDTIYRIFNMEKVFPAGLIVCDAIVTGIMRTVDFSKYMNYLKPPKTQMNELYNKYKATINQYIITPKKKIVKEKKDDYDTTKDLITTRIYHPSCPEKDLKTAKPFIEYSEVGMHDEVENHACEIAIIELNKEQIMLPPNNSDLGIEKM